jgi:hypothetical protein
VSSPIIAEPEVYGGIELDAACSFLLLFSDGLYEALEAATGTEHVNRDIASMVAAEFSAQATLSGVAQAVVDKVARNHHDAFIANRENCQERDDITLLIRNFNYPMPNAVGGGGCGIGSNNYPMANTIGAGVGGGYSGGIGGNQVYTPSKFQPLSLVIPASSQPQESPPKLMMFPNTFHNTATLTTNQATTFSSSNESSSGEMQMFMSRGSREAQSGPPQLPLDASGRLPAYVDFTALNALLEADESLAASLELKPGYETIPEEQEAATPTTPSRDVPKTPSEKDTAVDNKDVLDSKVPVDEDSGDQTDNLQSKDSPQDGVVSEA